jgi:hypothetical protein
MDRCVIAAGRGRGLGVELDAREADIGRVDTSTVRVPPECIDGAPRQVGSVRLRLLGDPSPI